MALGDNLRSWVAPGESLVAPGGLRFPDGSESWRLAEIWCRQAVFSKTGKTLKIRWARRMVRWARVRLLAEMNASSGASHWAAGLDEIQIKRWASWSLAGREVVRLAKMEVWPGGLVQTCQSS